MDRLKRDKHWQVSENSKIYERKRIQISLAARVIYLIFSALVYSVHYTPEAEEEQTEPSFPSYYIFTKHKSIVQWS